MKNKTFKFKLTEEQRSEIAEHIIDTVIKQVAQDAYQELICVAEFKEEERFDNLQYRPEFIAEMNDSFLKHIDLLKPLSGFMSDLEGALLMEIEDLAHNDDCNELTYYFTKASINKAVKSIEREALKRPAIKSLLEESNKKRKSTLKELEESALKLGFKLIPNN